MADESGWHLVVEFPDQSPSFAHGVEVGKLWERMNSGTIAEFDCLIMSENVEVMYRIAEYLGWGMKSLKFPRDMEAGSGWETYSFKKIAPRGRRDNPVGLRLVTS